MAQPNDLVEAVFTGQKLGNAMTNGAIDLINSVSNSISNVQNQLANPGAPVMQPQPEFDQFSRRNWGGGGFNPQPQPQPGMPMMQQPQQNTYTPATYVWGTPNQGHGVSSSDYPGISNPSYGKTGYVGATFQNFGNSSSPWGTW